ncbi:SDR family NAD(P)-dependent oxidoreductase [Saccharopolyspora griseoalba]|uniref:SDR family NAD(P)-dependent oxidoreductase n=1 Tax=Saccharopolyspora griseoalba TaxID=1431848 RepID=A0ABW2LHI9_9PSEU
MGLIRRDGTRLSRALVTGASSGIGAALAARLAGLGCEVVLTGRDEERLDGVATATGGRALAADLASSGGTERVAEAGAEADLVVHSAGIGWQGRLDAMPPERIGELVEVNLTALLRLTRALLPGLAERGGHLVVVSSIAAVGVREEAVYAATKAGVRAFAASLRHEGLRVTAVLPGAVRTPFFAGRDYARRFPRMVEADEVAAAALRGVRRERAEVFVPGWLTLPARIGGALPEMFHGLSRRFG